MTSLITLNLAFGVLIVSWFNPLSILQFLIVEFVNLAIAFDVSTCLTSLLVGRNLPPKLNKLARNPKVAILYCTCNDVMPALLRALRYQPYDVFVLDDSYLPEYKDEVGEICRECGFKLVRRGSRRGFKAGALNHWLRKYGNNYEYFVVLDSDSIIGRDFVEEMLKYAEHPLNRKVAVFQSKVMVWNRGSKFIRALSALFPVGYYFLERCGNPCDMMFSYGHNVLYRVSDLRRVGGFDERYISEDVATSMNLLREGHLTRLVDVVSYEFSPDTPNKYVKRVIKWAKNTLQLSGKMAEGLPFTTLLAIFNVFLNYIIWFLYLAGMIIAVWGYTSSVRQAVGFITFLMAGGFLWGDLLPRLLLIAFYLSHQLLFKLPFAVINKVKIRDYFEHIVLRIALSFYVMFPLIIAQAKAMLLRERHVFTITEKGGKRGIKFSELIKEMKYTLFLSAVLAIGSVRNPLSLVLNFAWLIPLFLSPLILYLYVKD